MNVLTTRELKERLNELQGQTVMLQGWIRNHRKQKNMGFIDFFDGTCFKNPQVVYDNTIEDYAAIQALHVGAAITVTGKVVPSYKDPTTPEVQAIAAYIRVAQRFPAAGIKQRLAVNGDAAAVRQAKEIHAAQQRGLAASGRADDGQRLALLQREADAPQNLQ